MSIGGGNRWWFGPGGIVLLDTWSRAESNVFHPASGSSCDEHWRKYRIQGKIKFILLRSIRRTLISIYSSITITRSFLFPFNPSIISIHKGIHNRLDYEESLKILEQGPGGIQGTSASFFYLLIINYSFGPSLKNSASEKWERMVRH